MARITVEDCLSKIDSQYDLVLLAKERTTQLNSGEKSLVPVNRDKNTVISLREIGEGKISIKTIEDSAITRLRKPQSEPTELEDLDTEEEDSFDKIYKGEISKSGAAILPSKRARRMPEYTSNDSKTEDTREEKETKETSAQVKEEPITAEVEDKSK
tara:strand:+ start:70 stop:540 length:471 start_codon:yes stop_codon:yes gene_type:complete